MEDGVIVDKYGFGYNLNESWQQRWEEVVSTDHDYDGDFLIRIITHKIKLMEEYFSVNGDRLSFPSGSNEYTIAKIIKTLQTAYGMGVKILTFNYGEAADELFEEKGNVQWLIESSEEEDYLEWSRLSNEATEARKKDVEKFFKYIGRHINSWWV